MVCQIWYNRLDCHIQKCLLLGPNGWFRLTSDTKNSATAAPPESWLLKEVKDFEESTKLGQPVMERSLDQSDNPVYLCINYDRSSMKDLSHLLNMIFQEESINSNLSDDEMQQDRTRRQSQPPACDQ